MNYTTEQIQKIIQETNQSNYKLGNMKDKCEEIVKQNENILNKIKEYGFNNIQEAQDSIDSSMKSAEKFNQEIRELEMEIKTKMEGINNG